MHILSIFSFNHFLQNINKQKMLAFTYVNLIDDDSVTADIKHVKHNHVFIQRFA